MKAKAQSCTICNATDALQTPCCVTYICADCRLDALYIFMGLTPVCYSFPCPICGKETSVPEDLVKAMIGERRPSHTITMRTCDGETAMIAHTACPNGCYRCKHSTIEAHAL